MWFMFRESSRHNKLLEFLQNAVMCQFFKLPVGVKMRVFFAFVNQPSVLYTYTSLQYTRPNVSWDLLQPPVTL